MSPQNTPWLLLALWLLVAASLPGRADSLQLKGRFLAYELQFTNKENRRVYGLGLDNGYRVRLVADEAASALLADVRPGARVAVQGEWRMPRPGDDGGGATPPGLSSGSQRAGAAPFFQSLVVEVEEDEAPPSPDPPADPDPATGSDNPRPSRRGVLALGSKTATVSTLPLVAADLKATLVPITAQGGADACTGTSFPFYTARDVRRMALAGAAPEGALTIGSIVSQCSHNKTTFAGPGSGVQEMVKLGCAGTNNGAAWSFQTCDWQDFHGWADAADAVLATRGVGAQRFKHRSYLLPAIAACGGLVGIAQVGCDGFGCRSWIGAYHWLAAMAITHEIFHNLYLDHSGRFDKKAGLYDEYGDDTCMLAYCCAVRCPNTPHAWQLGWISLLQLTDAQLGPGQTASLTVQSQSLQAANAGIRVVPGWAAGAPPVFVGYRTAHKGDAAMDARLVGKVHVYTSLVSGSKDVKMSNWEATLGANQAWEQPESGLVVRVKSTGARSAVVTVCRRAGRETLASCAAQQDNDCNGLVGSSDPTCVALARRPRGLLGLAASLRLGER